MAPSFGARLRAQRESRQVTLETIAEQTKIRAALLDGLERNDVSHWPGGIFRRSYLRSYAVAIGLDPEATVREFLALYPDAAEEPPAAVLADAEARRADHRPKTRLHYLLSSAIGAVSKPFDRNAASPGPPEPVENAAPIEMERAELLAQISTTPARVTPEVAAAAVSMDQIEPASGETSSDETAGELDRDTPFEAADETVEPESAFQVDLNAVAQLCTHLVEAQNGSEVEALLGEAARTLRAIGIVVWPWDPARGAMTPSLSHGYPRRTLARLPTLAADADNPIGAAFRSSARQIVTGGGTTTGAIVVPLTTPRGCSGVLAIEYSNGLEQDASIQALATILAAQLSRVVQAEPAARTAIA